LEQGNSTEIHIGARKLHGNPNWSKKTPRKSKLEQENFTKIHTGARSSTEIHIGAKKIHENPYWSKETPRKCRTLSASLRTLEMIYPHKWLNIIPV